MGGTAVFVCTASYWSYQRVRNVALEELQAKAFLEVQQGANEIDRWIGNKKSALGAIANNPTFRTMDWQLIEPYLQLEEKRLPDFFYLGMTDASMMLYTPDTPDKNGTIDLSDRQHIQGAMAGVNSLSDPLLSRSSGGRSIVVFAIPTFSGEATPDNPLGKPIGAVNAVIGTDKIKAVVNNLNYGQKSYAFALNSKGEAIVHPNAELMSTVEVPAPSLLDYGDPGLAEVAQRLGNQESGLSLFEIDGQKQYVAYVPLTEADWSVALVIPRSNIDGQLRPLDWMAMVVVGLTGTMLIVLWQVQTFEQQQLKRSKAAADMANQAKSDFLANMSHELRTPLNGILGYAQILGRTLDGKDREGINVIHQCGSHLLNLINDVLDLSKIEARKLDLAPVAVHLPSLLQSVVEMCRIKAEQKDIAFVYQPTPQLPKGVLVDEKRLRQVLINLLGNAIKFTEAGTVTLQVEVQPLSETEVSLHFQIIDTGVGINQADMAKLFEAFEQVGDQKKQSEGTGLGLAISQRIIHLMGGTIAVNSQLGSGSEFAFAIKCPLTETWVEQQSIDGVNRIVGYESQKEGQKDDKKRYRILVVDDRWENRAVLSGLLTPLGFTVLEAENGQVGLDMLQTQSPDLVIMDLVMPVMNGIECLRRIRQIDELKQTIVLVSSASVSQADQQLAMKQGGNDFLPKPVESAELFQLLAKHLPLRWISQRIQEIPGTISHVPVPPSAELAVPPRETLEELLLLAKRNRVRELRSQLEALKDTDSTYGPFADALLKLARQFRSEEIEKRLQQHLTGEATDA
ncbi:MAG: ATP-binding protein [Phormidesmis sp.]